MKKLFALIMALFAITACGPTSDPNPTSTPESTTTSASESITSVPDSETTTITSSSEEETTSDFSNEDKTEITTTTSTHTHTFGKTYKYNETHHWYPSTCGHDDAVEKIPHNFKSEVHEPTYEAEGYTTYTCIDCGYNYTGDKKPVLEHKYATTYSYDETHHWFACIDKGYEHLTKDKKQHNFKSEVHKPTYEEKGYTKYTCEQCKYNYIGDEKPVLEHNYSTTYSYDETYHWFACTDKGYENLTKDKKQHEFNQEIHEATHEERGYTKYTCKKCPYNYIGDYTDLLRYTITYILDGGENAKENPDSFTIEDSITLLPAKKDGYQFEGWYDEDGFSVETIAKGTRKNITLRARWSELFIIQDNVLIGFGDNVSASQPVVPDGVTRIGPQAFYYNTDIATITLPSSIKSFGSQAFDYCISLYAVYYKGTIEQWNAIVIEDKEASPMFYARAFFMLDNNNEWYLVTDLVIPSTVTTINKYSFCEFDCLQNVTIASSVTKIDYFGFFNCISLKEVKFETNSKLTALDVLVFGKCYSLETINLPNGLKSMGNEVFYECDSLKSIEIPKTCTTLGTGIFNECDSLTSVELPEISAIPDYTFSSCSSLQTVIMPSTLKTIGNYAFGSCISLIEMNIPSTVTKIGTYAFYFCTSLKSVKIPASVTTIGNYAFRECENSIIYAEATSKKSGWGTSWIDSTQIIYWGQKAANIAKVNGCEFIAVSGKAVLSSFLNVAGDIIIPSSVTIGSKSYKVEKIGTMAFFECNNMNSVVIPSSVLYIEEYGFGGNFDQIIYAEASSQPAGWDDDWNFYDCEVYWAGEWEYDSNGKAQPKA